MVIQTAIVAKFLCQRGLADRLIEFGDKAERPYWLWLEREPENRYDTKAIKVCVGQADGHTKAPSMQRRSGDADGFVEEDEIVNLTLGYIPKDLAYSLSQVLDRAPHIFEILEVSY